MTDERPTPETDKAKCKFTSLFGDDEDAYWVPLKLARCLERERDEARERADTMFAKHAEILDQYRRERDAERALADRLAEALKFIATDKIANANDMRFRANKALTAWKEARSE